MTVCSMGFCAEHAAVAERLEARESEIALPLADLLPQPWRA